MKIYYELNNDVSLDCVENFLQSSILSELKAWLSILEVLLDCSILDRASFTKPHSRSTFSFLYKHLKPFKYYL